MPPLPPDLCARPTVKSFQPTTTELTWVTQLLHEIHHNEATERERAVKGGRKFTRYTHARVNEQPSARMGLRRSDRATTAVVCTFRGLPPNTARTARTQPGPAKRVRKSALRHIEHNTQLGIKSGRGTPPSNFPSVPPAGRARWLQGEFALLSLYTRHWSPGRRGRC